MMKKKTLVKVKSLIKSPASIKHLGRPPAKSNDDVNVDETEEEEEKEEEEEDSDKEDEETSPPQQRLVPHLERDEELAPRRRPITVQDDLVLLFMNSLIPYFAESWESEWAYRTVYREPTPPPPPRPETPSPPQTEDQVETVSDVESEVASLSEGRGPSAPNPRPSPPQGGRASATKAGLPPGRATPAEDEGRRRSARRRRSKRNADKSAENGDVESQIVAEPAAAAMVTAVVVPEVPEEQPLAEWRLQDAGDELVRVQFVSGNRYEGRVSRKRPEGHGAHYWADGASYEGEWEAGRPTGRGELTWPDLSWYEGEVFAGFRHGAGTFLSDALDAAYVGEWRAGQRGGRGVLCFGHSADDFYEGDWVDDVPQGRGLRVYPCGTVYVGGWRDGRRHGIGTMVWPNGDVFRGHWEDGSMDGYGVYTLGTFFNSRFCFPPENVYRGMWTRGQRNGVGALETIHGGAYYGWFADNNKHGAGMVVCCDGTVVTGDPLFVMDHPVEAVPEGKLSVGLMDQERRSSARGRSSVRKRSSAGKRGKLTRFNVGVGHTPAGPGASVAAPGASAASAASAAAPAVDAPGDPAAVAAADVARDAEFSVGELVGIKPLAPRRIPFNRPDHLPDLTYHVDRWYKFCWAEVDAQDSEEEDASSLNPSVMTDATSAATTTTTFDAVGGGHVALNNRIDQGWKPYASRHIAGTEDDAGNAPAKRQLESSAAGRGAQRSAGHPDSEAAADYGQRAPWPSPTSAPPTPASKMKSPGAEKPRKPSPKGAAVTYATPEPDFAASRRAERAERVAARRMARTAAERERLQRGVLRALPALRRLYAQYARCACTCTQSPTAADSAPDRPASHPPASEPPAANTPATDAAPASATGAAPVAEVTPSADLASESRPSSVPTPTAPSPPLVREQDAEAGQPPPLLARILWWQLLRDCELPGGRLSLVDVDRAIAANPGALTQSPHDPFERMRMWQLVHALLEVTWLRYVRPVVTERPNLAKSFERLLHNDILPRAGRLVGTALTKHRDLLPLRAVHALYRSVGEPHSLRTLLTRVMGRGGLGDDAVLRERLGIGAINPFETAALPPPTPAAPLFPLRITDFPRHVVYGHNAVTAGGDVLYLPGSASLFDDQASAKIPPHGGSSKSEAAAAAVASPWAPRMPGDAGDAHAVQLSALSALGCAGVADCVATVCPAIKEDGFFINVDYELTLLEFLETLLEAGRRYAELLRRRRLMEDVSSSPTPAQHKGSKLATGRGGSRGTLAPPKRRTR